MSPIEGREPISKDTTSSQEAAPENQELEAEFNELLNQREQLRLQVEKAAQQAMGNTDVDYALKQTFKKSPKVLEKLKNGLSHEEGVALLKEITAMPWNRFGKIGELRKVINSPESDQIIELDKQIDAIYEKMHPKQGS